MDTPDSTTHFIYRIVCFITGKCYVGQTNNPKSRKRHHFYSLRKGLHCNILLQNAYDKYSKLSFYFEVLESGIPSNLINQREVYWIDHFDTLRNGYNLRPGGQPDVQYNAKPCRWNGIDYVSIAEAARKLKIADKTLSERLEKGYSSDSDMPGSGSNTDRHITVTWNGICYPSLRQAAVAIGLSETEVRRRMDMGYTQDSDMPCPTKSKQTTWNGKTYRTLSEAANDNNISNAGMRRRLKLGHKCDNDLKVTSLTKFASNSTESGI